MPRRLASRDRSSILKWRTTTPTRSVSGASGYTTWILATRIVCDSPAPILASSSGAPGKSVAFRGNLVATRGFAVFLRCRSGSESDSGGCASPALSRGSAIGNFVKITSWVCASTCARRSAFRKQCLHAPRGNGADRNDSYLRSQLVRQCSGIEHDHLFETKIIQGDTHRRGDDGCIRSLDFDSHPSAVLQEQKIELCPLMCRPEIGL